MDTFNRKEHWEKIYTSKELNEVSWYQSTPITSIEFIGKSGVSKTAKIIDIGGGDSFLVDNLLEKGYTDITVMDISETALNRAKKRLGEKAEKIKWIVADASEFNPIEKYDLWHDRAAFHFLTEEGEINNYVKSVANSIAEKGIFIVGTFSEQGPEKCSAIRIRQYSEEKLTKLFEPFFDKIECRIEDHTTPFNTLQNFVFCSFRKKQV